MKKIVLFLHGYGSNGSDLITLKDYFHLNQSETEFISPNAPEPCEFNYFGYQWFALNERSVEEIQVGLKTAFFYLDDIVNNIKKKFEINSEQISILGFSQGSMLATYYALQNENTFQNIFSLSGSLPNQILKDIELKNKNSLYGIGDDAAVIYSNSEESILISTDLLIEGVHFNLMYTPLKHLGYKAL